MDADLQRRGRRRPGDRVRTCAAARRRRGARRGRAACVERVLGEGAEVLARFPGARAGRDALRAALRLHHRLRAARPHGAARPTSSPPTRAPASSIPRSPSARTTSGSASSTGSRSRTRCAPDGTFDERVTDFAGRFVKEADADIVEALRASRPAAPRRALRALLPALLALRHAAALLREVELVHPHHRRPRPDAGRERDDRLAPRAHQARPVRQVAGGQRRLGALARALLGHAAADLGVPGRGLRRALLRRVASPTFASAAARCPTTSTARTSTRSTCACEACGGEMRRVPEVIDAWYDSGSMPFAQFHYPFEGEERSPSASRPTSSARRSTRPGAGSTRCSPMSTLRLRPGQLPQLRLPRA